MSSNPLRADLVQPENIEWLWRDRIPLGMPSIVAGKPDQGKSMLATHLAAEVTKQGHNVLYSSKERAFGLIEKPRFTAAGGVDHLMHYWRFSLPAQIEELAEHIIDKEIKLVVMDPVSAHFIGVQTGSDKIREVLNPLIELIEQTGTALLFIEHALKRVPPGADPLSAIRGNSSGIPAACAMGFLFGTDPQNTENKILACVKSNICDRPLAIQFEVDEVDVPGIDKPMPALVYDEEITFDPIRLIAREPTHGGKVGRPSDKRAAAAEWLTNYLAAAGQPIKSTKVQEDAKHYGMTSRTLRRAAQDMGIVKNPPGGGPNCTWELPEEILELLREGSDDEIEEAGEDIGRHLDVDGEEVLHGRPRDVLAYIDEHMPVEAEVVDDGELSFDDSELAKFLEGLN